MTSGHGLTNRCCNAPVSLSSPSEPPGATWSPEMTGDPYMGVNPTGIRPFGTKLPFPAPTPLLPPSPNVIPCTVVGSSLGLPVSAEETSSKSKSLFNRPYSPTWSFNLLTSPSSVYTDSRSFEITFAESSPLINSSSCSLSAESTLSESRICILILFIVFKVFFFFFHSYFFSQFPFYLTFLLFSCSRVYAFKLLVYTLLPA